ncbi:MAG: surface-adhesin E family protein [Burkholderiaceae bacterium]|jgi:hypothetical protein
MKSIRLFGLMIVALASGPAAANWVQYAAGENHTWFYEEPFLKREGGIRTFWIVKNLSAPDEKEAQSYRFLTQFDCNKSQYRYLSERAFKDPMGEGKILFFNDTFTRWLAAAPNGLMAHLQTHVCRRLN